MLCPMLPWELAPVVCSGGRVSSKSCSPMSSIWDSGYDHLNSMQVLAAPLPQQHLFLHTVSLGQLHPLPAVLLGRCLMAVASPASWILHGNQGFMIITSYNVPSEPPRTLCLLLTARPQWLLRTAEETVMPLSFAPGRGS